MIFCEKSAQYAHDVVLTSMRRRFNVMDVVWMSKRRRVRLLGVFFSFQSRAFLKDEKIF